MSKLTDVVLPVIVVLSGVGAHLFFFKHGERHLYPFRYVQIYLLCLIAGTAGTHYFADVAISQALRSTSALLGFHFLGLYSSLLIYRIFFNPLNKIPGPFLARITKFDLVLKSTKLLGHHYLLEAHQKYGPFLRIGPNDLSVTDPDGVNVISGAQTKCYKAPWYSNDTPLISMHTDRDRARHDKRRRVWAPAFSDKALRGYEKRIRKYNDLLIHQIEAFSGQSINMSKWFNLYSFDVMGDLGFGHDFDMLQKGEAHWAIKLLNGGMDPLGLGLPAWLFRTLIAIPGAAGDFHNFIAFCTKALDDRMKTKEKPENPDITHTLIEHFQKAAPEEQQFMKRQLEGDSRLIIVAGSDTTAATLVHLFYHLASDTSLQERVRKEVLPLANNDGSFTNTKLLDASFLNGSINETLRLNPPVPSGVFRKTPPEGVTIGKTFIPGDTTIQMPQYAMSRDDACYVDPQAFIPERWYSKPELIRHKDAFAPFSVGPYGCIGKNLAYMEIRLLTAELIARFDVSLAPGEDGSKLLWETTDHFTLGLAEFNCCFKSRN